LGGTDFGNGYAVIYRRDADGANNWGQVQQIEADDGALNDRFGLWLDIDGDTVVVGAPEEEDPSGPVTVGSAYIFERNQNGNEQWGQVKKLRAPIPKERDRFSDGIAIDGDVIGASAFLNDDNGDQAGLIYTFSRDVGGSDNWGFVEELRANAPRDGQRLGIGLSMQGVTLAAGAIDTERIRPGEAFIFSLNPITEFSVGGEVTGLAPGAALTIRNNGGDDVLLSNNGPYSFPTLLSAGALYDVTLVGAPGQQSCQIANASGTMPAQNLTDVNVICDPGSPAGTLSSIDFGEVIVDQVSDSFSATLRSSGAVTLLVTGTPTVANNDSFKVVDEDCSGADLALDETCSIDVICGVQSVGLVSSQLSIPTNAGLIVSNLQCLGVEQGSPAGTLSDLGFGDQRIGHPAERSVTLNSTGSAALQVLGSPAIEPAGIFQISSNQCDQVTLAAGQGCQIEVSCNAVLGTTDGELTIQTNAGDLSSELSCRGWNGFVDLTVSHQFSSQYYIPGDAIELQLTVRNEGPDSAINAQVTHLLPEAIEGAEWMCMPSGAAQCTTDGTGAIEDMVDIPVGDTLEYTLIYVSSNCCEIESQTVVLPQSDQREQRPVNNEVTTTVISDALFLDSFE